jgi:multidrug efflux pump subunit AcrA (membrane-fusion protein)
MEEVDEARSEFRISKLELDLAKEALNKKQVKAPFDGIVTELPVEVGEYCEPPETILRMVDTSRFYCVTNIDPLVASKLKLNDSVVYIAGNGTGESRLPGEIVFISPVVDPASGLLRIKALFANPDGLIRPGEGGFLELPEGD